MKKGLAVNGNMVRIFSHCSSIFYTSVIPFWIMIVHPFEETARVTLTSHLRQVSSQLTHAAAAKSLQSCLTLCDPIDGSPPGSPIPGILQAGTLEWVAISFSNAWKWKVKVKSLSRVWLLATPWTTAHQALRPWDFPGKSTGVGCHCLLRAYP